MLESLSVSSPFLSRPLFSRLAIPDIPGTRPALLFSCFVGVSPSALLFFSKPPPQTPQKPHTPQTNTTPNNHTTTKKHPQKPTQKTTPTNPHPPPTPKTPPPPPKTQKTKPKPPNPNPFDLFPSAFSCFFFFLHLFHDLFYSGCMCGFFFPPPPIFRGNALRLMTVTSQLFPPTVFYRPRRLPFTPPSLIPLLVCFLGFF